jgi:hypothetical protein
MGSLLCDASVVHDQIRSASRTVDKRWAITKLVFPLRSLCVACRIRTSVRESTELVASSRISTLRSANCARAMVIS